MKIEPYKPPLQRRWENLWYRLMPILAIGFLTIFSILPLPIPHYKFFTPDLALMGVFYWCVYRRDLLPLPMCFALGLFEDLFDGSQIGINAFIFSWLSFWLYQPKQLLIRASKISLYLVIRGRALYFSSTA